MDSRSKSSKSRSVARARAGLVLASASLSVLGIGCLERGLRPVNPCNRTSFTRNIEVTNVDKVDLLFMIDNSGSMREEQDNLIEEIPRLVRVLASGDSTTPADGIQDFPPVTSLHVGVISSDMGSGNQTGVRTCTPGLGDDGILRSSSRIATAPCMASYPSGTFEFMAGGDTNAFAATIGCVANLGTNGCGFEQQLEASLKALTPANAEPWTAMGYMPPRFYDAASGLRDRLAGHGTGANDGFLRPNSALAIVLVTDEEDCSVANYEIFSGVGMFNSIPPNVRCNTFSTDTSIVYPISRYVDGFIGLRRNKSLLIFSAIVGIPAATEAAASTGDFAAVLAHPDMNPRADDSGTMLVPSCNTVNGTAYPPIRMIQTAAELAARDVSVSVSSICSNSFAPAIDAIIGKIASALGGACLPRALNPEPATGRVPCEVLEVLPPAGEADIISDCTMLPGREFVEMDMTDVSPRQVCRVTQVDHAPNVVPDTMPGWYYDDFTPRTRMNCAATPQRIAFVENLSPPATGSEIRLSCLQTVAFGSGSDNRCDMSNNVSNKCFVGQFCDFVVPQRSCVGEPGRACIGDASCGGVAGSCRDTAFCNTGTSLPSGGASLTCDPVARTCGVACENDSECTSAGLVGFVCDLETNGSRSMELGVDLPAGADASVARGICVNPTCN